WTRTASRTMSSSSATASAPAKPPPTNTKFRALRRVASSSVESAMANLLSTWLGRCRSPSAVLMPTNHSARPGRGWGRETGPGVGGVGDGQPAEHVVAQVRRLLHGLEADTPLGQARDGQGARDGTGGHHQVVVGDGLGFALVGLVADGAFTVVDAHDPATQDP